MQLQACATLQQGMSNKNLNYYYYYYYKNSSQLVGIVMPQSFSPIVQFDLQRLELLL